MNDDYARVVALARRERELVEAGRLDELAALQAERDALIASLPAQAPPEARPYLERAAELQFGTEIALRTGLERARRELGALDTHRRVAGSYVAAPATASLSVTA